MMKRLYLAWIAILLTTIMWASSLIFAKIIYTEITPILFVALRYSIASPFLIVLVLISKKRSENLRNSRIFWKSILLAGLLGPFLSQVLQYIGLGMTSAGETLLLLNMSPVFAVMLAAPLLKEPITHDKIAGLVLATVGASLIVMGGAPIDSGFGILRIAGDLIIIISTLLFALNGIAGKIAVGGVDSISVTAFSTLFAVPLIWISALLFEDVTILFQLSPMSWVIVFWVGLVNSVIAFTFYYESMKYIEASRVQIALNLIAVWGVIMSFLILNEPTFPLQIVGGFLTILGVIVAQKRVNEAKNTDFQENDSNKL